MELILYAAILLIPIFMIPNMFIAITLAKRVLLYLMVVCACLFWIWGEQSGLVISRLDLMVFALFVYSIVSVSWATNKTVAIRDVIQLGAFIVMYLIAKTANVGTVILLLACSGCVAIVISFCMIRMSKKLKDGLARKDGALIKMIGYSRTVFPVGNIGGAGCVFMIGILASIYVCNVNFWIGVPLILGNLFGLWVCSNRATCLGTIVGVYSYVYYCG